MSAVGDVCQGDIVELAADVPVIDKDGMPCVLEHPGGVWLVVGNSCDFVPLARERSVDATRSAGGLWGRRLPRGSGTQAVHDIAGLLRASVDRRGRRPCFVADFLRPVTVDKRVFAHGHAKVLARLTRAAWILLNACLVRFLARDDGRYAA